MSNNVRILVIDNYDSFVYTIVGYLRTLNAIVDVVRNDDASITQSLNNGDVTDIDAYDGVLISPGPGAPIESGVSEDVIRACAQLDKPMLGICLGLQALAEVFGANIYHAPTIKHGKTDSISHTGEGIFEGVANPMTATRYHSLAIDPDTLPKELQVIAHSTSDNTIQGVAHTTKPMYAVQFHPESVMTQDGYRLLANWLQICGQQDAVKLSEGLQPKVLA
ncbi:MAG: aminodeoxychorismate/anthranilate synthase component II [Bifidobacteriaceae bacterium]|nr:aminodeoxychorismate/anthranilate synthase component II [Bifidobacteriaceae bacterium]